MAKQKNRKVKFRDKSEDSQYIKQMLEILENNYPHAHTALNHKNPLQLLVSTILSAQCTDERVNKVTEKLFKKYHTAQDYEKADPEELKDLIRSTGFYNNKAKNIMGMAKKLVSDFNGEVPGNMEDLISLPGVARKTANVVLGNVFDKAVGVVVDTHVKRLSFRLGLSDEDNPDRIEKALMEIIPRGKWIWISHALIDHGRKICNARKPDCEKCPLNDICPSAFRF